jgi:hypothetical protein
MSYNFAAKNGEIQECTLCAFENHFVTIYILLPLLQGGEGF